MAVGVQRVADEAAGAVVSQVVSDTARGHCHLVIALQEVVTCAAVDHIVAVVACDLVVAGARIDHIITASGIDHVISGACIDEVVAIADVRAEPGATREVAIGALRAWDVGAGVPGIGHHVLPLHGEKPRQVGVGQRIDELHHRREYLQAPCGAHCCHLCGQRELTLFAGESVVGTGDPRARPRAAIHGRCVVVVAVGKDHIAAIATNQGVIALSTEQRVIVPHADKQVIADVACKHVDTASRGRLHFTRGDGIGQGQLSAAVHAVVPRATAQKGLPCDPGRAAEDHIVALSREHRTGGQAVGVEDTPVVGLRQRATQAPLVAAGRSGQIEAGGRRGRRRWSRGHRHQDAELATVEVPDPHKRARPNDRQLTIHRVVDVGDRGAGL